MMGRSRNNEIARNIYLDININNICQTYTQKFEKNNWKYN
jgi:hypothetical protein